MNSVSVGWGTVWTILAACVAGAFLPTQAAGNEETKADARSITIVLTDNSQAVGTLVSIDDKELVLKVGATQRMIPLDQVTPTSVYMARRLTMDLTKASSHMELAQYLLDRGLKALAGRELDQAVRIDPSLAQQAKAALAAAKDAPAAPAQTRPAASGKPGAKDDKPKGDDPNEPRKFQPATDEQASANTRRAIEMADKAKAFSPTMHLVETRNFLVFSAWDPSNDKPLADICQAMYAALCKQFDIPADQNIWAGKCAIYVFWVPDQFKRFATEVDNAGAVALDAAGYQSAGANGFRFMVLNKARTKEWFFEVLVHEGTHAFVSRYVNDRPIAQWANEGLAETMAGTLVHNAMAEGRIKNALREAVKENKDVSYVLQKVGVNDFDYGIAQSFVRFLIARDRKAFIRFFTLMKEGKTDEQALQEAYGLTHQQFLAAWAKALAAGRH